MVPATQLTDAPAEVYEALDAAGPELVIAQLGQSLDGFIAASVTRFRSPAPKTIATCTGCGPWWMRSWWGRPR